MQSGNKKRVQAGNNFVTLYDYHPFEAAQRGRCRHGFERPREWREGRAIFPKFGYVPSVPSLYAIVDTDACAGRGLEPLAVAAGLLRCAPRVLQLRAKGLAPREHLQLLSALRAITPPTTWLFGNDRPDLALLAGCDGVHLGQTDLPLEAARRFAPRLKLGISTHNLSQLRCALEAKPDYVALGPIFATSSKRAAEPQVGTQLLGSAHALCQSAQIPLVAIGGISLEGAFRVAPHADLVAAIDALLPKGRAGRPEHSDPAWVEQQVCSQAAAFSSALSSSGKL